MKKLISFILAMVLMVTAVPALFVTAEDEVTPGFVVDGKLDQWYRDDDWAVENECYFYFNGMSDTTLDVISRKPNSQDNGQLDIAEFYEDVKVKIYAAYDERYAYFYVDVLDPHIATSYLNADGTQSETSQYIENIDFYVDTDVMSCEGIFWDNCASFMDADTHFRMIAHNKVITDTRPEDKYIFEQENVINDSDGNPRYDASGFFSHETNVVPFHTYDDEGNLIGYGCEARVPLAYWYGETVYREFYYNIAVTNSATEDDPTPCVISTGKRWWVAYDTGKTVFFEPEEVNPFFGDANKDDTPDTPTDVEPQLMMGDPNDDKVIDAKDALVVLRITVGKILDATDAQKTACDVDGDGVVGAKDALEILKHVVKKPSALDKYFG